MDHGISKAKGELAETEMNISDEYNPKTSSKNDAQIIQPHSHLPKPEAPPGLSQPSPLFQPSQSLSQIIRERSTNLSAVIAKRLSSLTDDNSNNKKRNEEDEMIDVDSEVTEFRIPGLKVIVRVKNELELKGRISFFSRSNCRDCTAVRTFLKERGLRFVEINMDVFPERETELMRRTGSRTVPQIFFNGSLFGGLVALNSLRNSGDFDQRLRQLLGSKCSGDEPAPPLYGFDKDPEGDSTDEMLAIVRVLRQRLPIHDRLMKLKLVKNCFAGNELVELLIHHLDCGRRKALEIGKQLGRKHFIHHVFGENDFEDGNQFYRFLEHEPYIPRCYNFRASTNDMEPKAAVVVGQRLTKIMSAILESYASDDRTHVDYFSVSKSEEFRRYVNLAQDLQRVDLQVLSLDEKLAFFLNLYNAMVIHAVISIGSPQGLIDSRSFFSDFQYVVGGHPYSLNTIKHGILRNNRRPPYSLIKPFRNGDKRLQLAPFKVNPLIHFGLCDGTRSSPKVRFFSSEGIEAELRCAARDFFQKGGIEVDLDKRTVYLSRILKWFSVDFGPEKEMLKWIIKYVDATKAGLLMHLLDDGGSINIVYQNFDWLVNCLVPT
ncbi:Glutaredoxin domain-containing protein/DEP domain-containing protein/DUF547 domain-containing protein [Cephalotus follicularis]|uniref:Glutaredoxin domain-containing protein/DEP domain-containing protein/DUF547 domain-containing protein n=1 Tax=Cephalotus follicularis TaxID=3775 RepID=A0A1Q3BPN9_CEPFO|nr:Glutaredoxin domain-containing protein/DEP domain-containing protein/DUF547 domain-containing protein [Cephalotus follicularis]